MGKPISLAHARVAKLVRQLGVQATTQHQAGEGMPSVDLAIGAPDGRQIALQVCSFNIQNPPCSRTLAVDTAMDAQKGQEHRYYFVYQI